MIHYTRQLLVLFMLSAVSSAYGMNAIKPHNWPWRPIYRNIPYSLQIGVYFEKGVGHTKAFDEEKVTSNPLQIYTFEQNAIASLLVFPQIQKRAK